MYYYNTHTYIDVHTYIYTNTYYILHTPIYTHTYIHNDNGSLQFMSAVIVRTYIDTLSATVITVIEVSD